MDVTKATKLQHSQRNNPRKRPTKEETRTGDRKASLNGNGVVKPSKFGVVKFTDDDVVLDLRHGSHGSLYHPGLICRSCNCCCFYAPENSFHDSCWNECPSPLLLISRKTSLRGSSRLGGPRRPKGYMGMISTLRTCWDRFGNPPY